MYKLVVVVRDDLKLSKGKACAQVGHAVLDCFMRQSDTRLTKEWLKEGGKKVVLKCKDLKELHEVNQAAKNNRLVTAVIEDAGHTEVPTGTITCVGIGPDSEEKIDKVSGHLKPL
jgi:PTH2 family peptidyl-tRNA hydrolase